jgi:glycosyltransferase involved in cell wall biosynthesis
MATGAVTLELSLVVPVYDEEANLRALHERVCAAFRCHPSWELLLVDDCSADGSADMIRALADEDERVRGIFLDRHCGQTTALRCGLERARGAHVAILDADLQTDPAEVHLLLEALGENDAVAGYRVQRRDGWLRRISSRIANGVRNRLSGDVVRDTGCPLKVFRTEAVRGLPLFEGMHRFLPTLLRMHGYTVVEHPVSHFPRRAGRSKYGIRNRTLLALRDLLAVRWMRSRVRVPGVAETEPARRLRPRPRSNSSAEVRAR